jgi:hypothetical protein
MKLVDISKISPLEQGKLDVVVGVDQGKLVMVAKKKGDREWVLFQNAGQKNLKRESLIRLGSLSTLDDILAYFRGKKLQPCFQRSESDSSQQAPAEQDSVRNMVERRYYRKSVSLNGEYRNRRTGSVGDILVEDVSFKGIKFTTIGLNDIQVEDQLQVSFTLDDSKRSVIKRKVLAKYVKANDIGAEFVNPPEYDKELGFYLI